MDLSILKKRLSIDTTENGFFHSSLRAHKFIESWDKCFLQLTDFKSGHISSSATVHPTAIIGENVFVGGNVQIGPYCYIRSNSILFDSVILGYGVELDRIILFENTKISHSSNFGRSIVGENCNFAFGCVTATKKLGGHIKAKPLPNAYFFSDARHHGAFIGNNSVTGVNASIMPGATIPPNSVIFPGKIIKGVYGE